MGRSACINPRLPEFLLGCGGLGIAFLITTVSVRVLNFIPQDKPYIAGQRSSD